MITKFQLFESKIEKTKVDFKWKHPNGQLLKFKNITVYKNHDFIPMMGVSQTIRQYIKQVWKGVPFQISTTSYSGGDSVRVHLSPVNVGINIYEDIKTELKIIFQEGNFDGMTDTYEYRDKNETFFVNTSDGRKLHIGTKYLFVDYEPKYGTKEFDKYKEWKKINDEADKYNI